MNSKFGVLVFLICIALISGCVGNGNLTPGAAKQLARSAASVQEFLNEHPNAQITAVFWSSDYVSTVIDQIRTECGPSMQIKDYYFVTINEGSLTVRAYIDDSSGIVTCIIKPASDVPPQNTSNESTIGDQNETNEDQNETNENQNETQQCETSTYISQEQTDHGRSTDKWIAQSFKATQTGTVNKVSIKTGSGLGSCSNSIGVYADNSGKPGATLITGLIEFSSTSSSNQWIDFALFGNVNKDTTYWIVAKNLSNCDIISNYGNWVGSSSSNYANGKSMTSQNNGATWESLHGADTVETDRAFKIKISCFDAEPTEENESYQNAISIESCNATHALVRNIGATTLTKDADIYNAAGTKVGALKISTISGGMKIGTVQYINIQNTTTLTSGVYNIIDEDYPTYTFTCTNEAIEEPVQNAMSIVHCNATHALVRNIGATTLTKDADIYNAAGTKVGVLNISSVTGGMIAGAVQYVPISNTSAITSGVYNVVDEDYPNYQFTCDSPVVSLLAYVTQAQTGQMRSTDKWIAQSFKATQTGTITQVTIRIGNVSVGSCFNDIGVYEDNTGKPVTSPLTGIVQFNSTSYSNQWADFQLSGYVVKDNTYWIVTKNIGCNIVTDYGNWEGSVNNFYADGSSSYSQNNGTTWNSWADEDRAFEVTIKY